jgi:hypothetical protein
MKRAHLLRKEDAPDCLAAVGLLSLVDAPLDGRSPRARRKTRQALGSSSESTMSYFPLSSRGSPLGVLLALANHTMANNLTRVVFFGVTATVVV